MSHKNAISIDLEDWFCAYSLSSVIQKGEWDNYELRISESAKRILDLLHRHKTRATFFVLGWIAERFPGLIRDIEKANHEIAIHGYSHLLLTQITPAEFEKDLVKALETLKKCGIKHDIAGYRTPSFTLVEKTKWALEILEKHNIKYDSSIFPVPLHMGRGISGIPLGPYKITEKLYEFPLSCVRFFGINIPFGGGICFRFLPYAYTKYCIMKCNAEKQPVVFYIHPWELDAGQPKLKLPPLKYLRHYYNIDKTEKKLNKLLTDFQFTTIREVLEL